MRQDPSKSSPIVSQALFSEPLIFKKKEGPWSYISTEDGYEGWILSPLTHSTKPYLPNFELCRPSAHLYVAAEIEYGPMKTLPYGIKLQVLEKINERWSKIILPDNAIAYIQNGDIAPTEQLKKEDIPHFSQQFLGIPYTWGGRSSFGYDCSGFVQMLYKKIGKALPRDAKDQMLSPLLQPISFDQIEPADLIFFGQTQDKIGHVGMYLENGSFIHASSRENKPWVRISHLSDFEWSARESAYYSFQAAYRLSFSNMARQINS